MTNEEKAIEIAKKFHVIYDDYYDSMQECIESAIQMHEWTKQQMIEKICKWLDKNASRYALIISNTSQSTSIFGSVKYCGFDTDKLIEDIKKAMEDEQ